jgi:hypothetical protein
MLKSWKIIYVGRLLKYWYNKQVDFALEKTIEYLDIGEDGNKFYLWDAIGCFVSQQRSVYYYYSLLNEDHMPRIRVFSINAVRLCYFWRFFLKLKRFRQSVLIIGYEFIC